MEDRFRWGTAINPHPVRESCFRRSERALKTRLKSKKTVLTDSEVLALYNGGKPLLDYTSHSKGADLVAYWKLESNSASGLGTDSSGRDNHLDTVASAMSIQTNSELKRPGELSLPWSQRRMTVPGLMSLRTNP